MEIMSWQEWLQFLEDIATTQEELDTIERLKEDVKNES